MRCNSAVDCSWRLPGWQCGVRGVLGEQAIMLVGRWHSGAGNWCGIFDFEHFLENIPQNIEYFFPIQG